ncbi:LysE family translocator [Rivihabitans pingtungensis]|uniref:Threonine/homoserine/homoserine lactone efflux protein n=1 Tax=Rivihabitans pingtungensis TaxID=1054498 RepID=A0A318L018_9NEIS|nr:LysE family translocator [Rivihabitans pingtungensis]PXX81295.1 threonine/homoserine/homoserine lactone efflux protein [Rivihabitans pingtungensis]
MQHWTALLGITAAIGIGAASPGPSFVMVARTAASQGRPHGLLAAAGIGTGGLIFAILALLGLHSLLNLAPTLYLALKLAGGLYLAWLGWRIWRGARQALALHAAPSPHSQHRAFAAGLATQLSNPKTAIVYTSVFAAFLPEQPELSFKILTALAVLLVETGWYTLAAWALSAPLPRQAYLRSKTWVDRAAGGVMMALGLKLAWEAVE